MYCGEFANLSSRIFLFRLRLLCYVFMLNLNYTIQHENCLHFDGNGKKSETRFWLNFQQQNQRKKLKRNDGKEQKKIFQSDCNVYYCTKVKTEFELNNTCCWECFDCKNYHLNWKLLVHRWQHRETSASILYTKLICSKWCGSICFFYIAMCAQIVIYPWRWSDSSIRIQSECASFHR